MNEFKWSDFWFAFGIGGMVVGLIFGVFISNAWKQSVVDHKCAYYDPETKDFTWYMEKNDE